MFLDSLRCFSHESVHRILTKCPTYGIVIGEGYADDFVFLTGFHRHRVVIKECRSVVEAGPGIKEGAIRFNPDEHADDDDGLCEVLDVCLAEEAAEDDANDGDAVEET